MSPRPATLREYDNLFYDCETGGLSPAEADIVEVAAIRTDPTGTKVLEEYSAKVLPKMPVNPRAAAINGYSAEKWAAEGAVELGPVISHLVNMAQNAIFTAHNAPFDWMFFEAAMKKYNLRWRSDYHKYDTVSLAMPLLRLGLVPDLKLTTLTSYFGIPHEAHRAMGDVRACRELYLRLMPAYDKVAEAFKNG